MKVLKIVAAAVAVVGATWLEPAFAATATNANAYAITGTYSCVTHEGGQPDSRFKSVNTPWGQWMRVNATFPAQNGMAPISAMVFIGFDSHSKRWSIISIASSGSYYTRHSTSRELDGSRWTDNFPSDGGTGTIRVSPTAYTFDFIPGKGENDEASHTVCTRL